MSCPFGNLGSSTCGQDPAQCPYSGSCDEPDVVESKVLPVEVPYTPVMVWRTDGKRRFLHIRENRNDVLPTDEAVKPKELTR